MDIPGLGVTFDVNDLGNFCGIAYLLLMTLLVFSLVREHENLYLALFKVRRLHQHGKVKSDGENTANYLYHALAMSQVLSSPPTLAQWAPPWIKTKTLNLVFLVPALVEAYVVYENWKTLGIGRLVGKEEFVLYPQYVFLLINVSLGILAIFYSMSCNRRWKSAFFYINPELRRVRSRPFFLWLGLSRSSSAQRRMWNQAVDGLAVVEKGPTVRSPIKVDHDLPIRASGKIKYRKIKEMCRTLEKKVAAVTGLSEAAVASSPREVLSSVLRDDVWRVTARFFGQDSDRHQSGGQLHPEQLAPVHAVVELLTRAWLEGRKDDLERLWHPSAVFVGPGLAGRIERGIAASRKSYQNFGDEAKVEAFEIGDPVIEIWSTTAVVNYPFTVKYLFEGTLCEESGRELLVLVKERGAWLVVWRTLIMENATAA